MGNGLVLLHDDWLVVLDVKISTTLQFVDNEEWSLNIHTILFGPLSDTWSLRLDLIEVFDRPLLVCSFMLTPQEDVLVVLIFTALDIDDKTSLVLDVSSEDLESLPPAGAGFGELESASSS